MICLDLFGVVGIFVVGVGIVIGEEGKRGSRLRYYFLIAVVIFLYFYWVFYYYYFFRFFFFLDLLKGFLR